MRVCSVAEGVRVGWEPLDEVVVIFGGRWVSGMYYGFVGKEYRMEYNRESG